MRRLCLLLILVLVAGVAIGCTKRSGTKAGGPAAASQPLFEGLGSHTRKVTTTSPEAQRYFDQGLTFLYAFNHDEAIRSFRQAAELDPSCAMALVGRRPRQRAAHQQPGRPPEAHAKAAWAALEPGARARGAAQARSSAR